MEVTPGRVLCPACSGTGECIGMYTRDACRLCGQEGEVTEEVAEEFWECMQRKHPGRPGPCCPAEEILIPPPPPAQAPPSWGVPWL